MLLTICIPSLNTRQLLRNCIQSICDSGLLESEYQLIVVDNGSTDGTQKMLKRKYPQVCLIKNPKNFGFAAAVNQVSADARSRYVMLLNSDTLVQANSIKRMIEFLESTPSAGAVGPNLIHPDGRKQKNARCLPQGVFDLFVVISLISYKFPSWRPYRRQYVDIRDQYDPVKVGSVSGASILFRSETLHEVGLFDDGFFLFLEITDYCTRMQKMGWETYLLPYVNIVHLVGGSHHYQKTEDIEQRVMAKVESYRSCVYFAKKHFGGELRCRILLCLDIMMRLVDRVIFFLFSRDRALAWRQMRYLIPILMAIILYPRVPNRVVRKQKYPGS